MPVLSIRLLFLILCGTLVTGCVVTKPTVSRLDPIPRLAVISAFDAELEKLRSAAKITGTEVINGRTHYLGTLEGHDVVQFLDYAIEMDTTNQELVRNVLLAYLAIGKPKKVLDTLTVISTNRRLNIIKAAAYFKLWLQKIRGK